MARLIPFRAIRPSGERAAEIAALPYDVYSRSEAAEEVAKNPESFLAIDRAETGFGPETDPYAPEVYERAGRLLWQWVDQGRFQKDDEPCFYLYELTMDGRTQTGIVGLAAADDYKSGVIKKHENTRADKEEDRVRHVDACRAQTGPIFLAYRRDPRLDGLIKESKKEAPLYDFVSEDGVRHRVFAVCDGARIARIEEIFAGMDRLYIADGHHRAASAVRVCENRRQKEPERAGDRDYDYILSVLFPGEELRILDYNRVVTDLAGQSTESFLEEVKRRFDITEVSRDILRPRARGEFCMYLKETWYRCLIREKDRSDDPVKGLDVSLLQDLLLEPVLKIKDPRTDARIDFVGGIRGPEELERRCREGCEAAFAMYPTSIEELFAVADSGKLMPPKSTWFEPKLRSGLFIHEIG